MADVKEDDGWNKLNDDDSKVNLFITSGRGVMLDILWYTVYK